MKHIHMPRALFEKWDAALRSGQYIQGYNALEGAEPGTRCCLGVLEEAIAGDIERHGYGAAYATPSIEWLRQHGIKFFDQDGCPAKHPYSTARSATAISMNDTLRLSFAEIADALRDEVEFTD
jgi:hypothetical protein